MWADVLYLDSAATSPVRREALEAMWPFLMNDFGNSSSRHTVGESAARALEAARAEVAAWLGCRPASIIFTAGGTEADNLAVKGIALGNRRGGHIVTTAIEHEAVLESASFLERFSGFEVSFVPITSTGFVTQDALHSVLRPDTTLVSIAHANNEVGTVQDIAALTSVTAPWGVPFHTDAVQSAGWLDTRVDRLGVQALTISGHKLGAPKGIGALYVAGRLPLEPVIHGGGQERGRRSGTENIAGSAALAVAVRLAESDRERRAASACTARDAFIADVLRRVPDSRLTGPAPAGDVDGDGAPSRLPANASFVFPGTSGESVLLELERRGVVSSSGSACAAGSDEPSHVLTALGVPAEVAQTSVRFTWSGEVTSDQLGLAAAAVESAVGEVRAIRR